VYQDQVLDVAVALAGFSQGQAESLRRAMSRRRSREAMVAHWHSFRDGARGRGVGEPIARQVFEKIVAFSEFGFPKAHAAAFGLLAYQSAWLRRHYPAEFLCALLNEQPMGFYPPASLVRDAQRRGVEIRAPGVNDSHALCGIEPDGAVRIGLSYVRGLGQSAALGLVEAREADGPYADVADLVRRAGLSLPECERVIASGACDAFGPRREQLWRAGLIARPESTRGGRQLALDLEIGTTPALPTPGAWDELVADYETTGVSVRDHALAQLRAGLTARGFVTTAALEQLPSGTPIRIAGLTVARQRPASAKGVVFLLLEDEHGLVNLVLFSDVYEQHRLLARTEPLLEAYGKLERRDRNINVIVERLLPLGTPSRRVLPTAGLQPVGSAQIFEELPMAVGDDVTRLRENAPGAHHFGQGRGRR
jgi:error-prone DNA polymerase